MIKWNKQKNALSITIEIRSSYGTDRAYPACKNALAFCDIARTRTLSAHTIKELKAMGYQFEVIRTPSAIEKILAE